MPSVRWMMMVNVAIFVVVMGGASGFESNTHLSEPKDRAQLMVYLTRACEKETTEQQKEIEAANQDITNNGFDRHDKDVYLHDRVGGATPHAGRTTTTVLAANLAAVLTVRKTIPVPGGHLDREDLRRLLEEQELFDERVAKAYKRRDDAKSSIKLHCDRRSRLFNPTGAELLYYVISNYNITVLQEEVNMFMRAGWKPLGGLTYASTAYSSTPAQAMYLGL